MIRKKVTVEVVGGLGNQLFCYAAGLFLANKISKPLVLNMGLVGKGGTDHGKSLLNYRLKNVEIDGTVRSNLASSLLARANNKLVRHIKSYSRMRNWLMQVYNAKNLGFEAEFMKLNKPLYLIGYFQSYRYIEPIKDELEASLQLSKTSKWYTETLAIMKNLDPTVIHVRRGDYKKLADDFGLLPIKYYTDALNSFNGDFLNRPIWIFTDSPHDVSAEIIGTSLEGAEIMSHPSEVTPNELISMMSKAKRIVISNSTFSWWAAYLSENGTKIVAPEKWFRNRQDPVDLIPPNWSLIRNGWR